ncbi:hypothetical protein [Hyalangium versicolor]|uniref:hypothetical protein n=1 Tax=Hyalangium versicolor TaxID=2861190 RepID=UPI001CCB4A18|nr:hypothetical protein [Hyalangium versicolor]
MPDVDPRKDPRFRSFRAAAYGIHVLVSTIFSLWLIVNVSLSVGALTPEKLPHATGDQVLSFRACVDGAQKLWTDLENQRETLVHNAPARSVDQQWMRFRTGWLARLREHESRCPERPELRTLVQRLEQVQDLYTIHAVQYAGEVGGAVDALQDAFDAARRSADSATGP